MKRISFIFILFLVSSGTLLGQKTEVSLQGTTTFSAFGGANATRTSGMLVSGDGSDNYTNDPYGKYVGVGYGAAIQLQRVTQGRTILGLQTGYEVLRSRVKITSVYNIRPEPTPIKSGETVLRNDFININPYAGHRFTIRKIDLDLTGGLEIAFFQESREKGSVTTANGQTYYSDRERFRPGSDIRGRLNLTGYYKHIGISLGYAHGIKNYTPMLEGATLNRYARVVRLGINYRI
ncbi:outer membrane beta-barrel protein [Adhaeribacter aquaticus]|uniref:outer membrane beta-barrel protein n=1 Tax=Adhaeribacter aquaticus TaxID=299567 RepID=UPI000427F15E|nr:outer membrane beta-barrel protein [Adhaeribacter aquaticus]